MLTTVDQINQFIACEKDTPCSFSRSLKYRRERLKTIEAYIRSRDLKARKAVTLAQVAGNQGRQDHLKLVAWMDVVV